MKWTPLPFMCRMQASCSAVVALADARIVRRLRATMLPLRYRASSAGASREEERARTAEPGERAPQRWPRWCGASGLSALQEGEYEYEHAHAHDTHGQVEVRSTSIRGRRRVSNDRPSESGPFARGQIVCVPRSRERVLRSKSFAVWRSSRTSSRPSLDAARTRARRSGIALDGGRTSGAVSSSVGSFT